jgi:homoisocitrate dehydrogenase
MKICLLGGDGIGPEVTAEAVRVLEALSRDSEIRLDFSPGDIGYGAYRQHGTPLPDATLALARSADATLLGAVTTPPGIPGYTSPVLGLRRQLDLFACVRPIRSRPGAKPAIDMVIVRENTEGLYAGREHATSERAVTERVITRAASQRIARFAFEEAERGGYDLVTIVHKANVLRETCGLFRSVALDVATEYPGIHAEEMLVDTCAMELIRAPERFQVIVTTNLFGDILSDEAAMLVGGLGLAASANIGADHAVFEPVHGSAPDLAGTGRANPLAAIRAAATMMRYLHHREIASRIESALESVLESKAVTPDLGGTLSTTEVTSAVIAEL